MKKIIVLIIILLVLGAYLVKEYNNFNLKEEKDLKSFIKVYSGWIYSMALNVKDITGYIISKSWLPENNQTETKK